jgi:hypothetical protein
MLTDDQKHRMAVNGFKILGQDALPAVPCLVRLTKKPNYGMKHWAVYSLVEIKPPKEILLPVLLQALNGPDDDFQSFAGPALARLYPEEAEKAGVYDLFPDLRPDATKNGQTNSSAAR